MKYLVTGGAGFIGSNLVDALVAEGHQVVVIDNLVSGKKENVNPKADFYQLDICDFEKIRPLFEGVDFVFHLAAIPRVPISVQKPIETSQVNIMGTINVFKAAAEAKVSRVVFASSSSVYGNQKDSSFKETMVPNPLSPYALQKLVGEQVAKLFTNLYNIPIISLRYFNIYGPRIDFDSDYGLVVGKFLQQSGQKKPLTIFGDGQQTRAFIYIDDIVRANIKAMESKKIVGGEVINIGQEKAYSVNHLAQLIGGQVQHLPPRVGDALHTLADITLARELLGWEPETEFEAGIQKTKEWFKNYGK
ncbi:MAG: SDR family NAD(P)-dependent oxidoreductase [bacterium]|nr:SDR family NAD(P)-dependent oxidoreductase [bacterium]